MSLIAFHRFLITTAILFSLGLAVRQWSEFQATAEPLTLITAIAFGIAAVGLAFYLRHLGAILHLRAPQADLRPFVKRPTDHFSHPALPSSEGHEEAEATDA